jgi:hypothetical protein
VCFLSEIDNALVSVAMVTAHSVPCYLLRSLIRKKNIQTMGIVSVGLPKVRGAHSSGNFPIKPLKIFAYF